jgi:flavorubredoxin
VLGTAKCKEGLEKNYHQQWPFKVVKSGDAVSLGKRTLQFIEAPMIHWPDSMFTYCPEEKLLLPNDAFGQHYATSERFDDEVDQCALMEESAKYYANILIPLSSVIARKLQDVRNSGLEIDMIAPSHGVIWRGDPGKILEAYARWSQNTVRPKVIIVYETMWGTTAKMARHIAQGILDAGCEVKMYDIATSDTTEIVTEFLDAKGIVLGSSTHDNDLLPIIAGFATFFKGLKPKNRVGGAFGSYGWAGGAVGSLEGILKEAGVEQAQPSLAIQYVPDEAGYSSCYEWGTQFAGRVL